jgi:Uma2 family endonuclease
MTIDQDATTPATDEDRFHDIVAGRRLVKTLNVRDIMLANRLFYELMTFEQPRRSGRFFFGLNFDLGLGDETQRMPEISFVSFERYPARKRLPSDDPWRMTPDLVAEIVTPSCSRENVERKVDEYRRTGVRLIWQIVPDKERVVVYRENSRVQILSKDGILDGGDVLSAFRMSLTNLFEDEP